MREPFHVTFEDYWENFHDGLIVNVYGRPSVHDDPAKPYWPKAHIDRLEQEAVKAARSKAVSDKLSQDTALAVGNTRAEFEAFIKQEQARWKPVIARAKIVPEGA